MHKYRIYADGDIVHEDDFHMYDEGGECASPFYDDYSVHVVPEDDENAEYWDVPEELRDYVIAQRGKRQVR